MDEARGLLDGSAPGALPAAIRQGPGSYTNALRGERMAVARNFDEFLTYAPRIDLSASAPAGEKAVWSCAGNPAWVRALGHCPTAQRPPAFDVDAVTVFNRELPLEMLVQAAQAETVPPNLRGYLALAAWTRAVVLEDAANAAKLAPLLPQPSSVPSSFTSAPSIRSWWSSPRLRYSLWLWPHRHCPLAAPRP